MSNSLVFLSKDNIPLTTSLAIAGALKYQHKNVIALIRKYIKELQTFNPITFKKLLGTKLPQGGYTKPTEYAVLDEKQATLLICFMQNNEKVRAFKIALVKAFYQMKEILSQKLGYYTPEQISNIKSTYRKQGYALAMKNIEKNQQDKLELSGENKKKLIQVLEFLYQQREKSLDFIGEITDLQRKLEQVKEHLNLSGSNLIGTHSTLLCALKKLNDK